MTKYRLVPLRCDIVVVVGGWRRGGAPERQAAHFSRLPAVVVSRMDDCDEQYKVIAITVQLAISMQGLCVERCLTSEL